MGNEGEEVAGSNSGWFGDGTEFAEGCASPASAKLAVLLVVGKDRKKKSRELKGEDRRSARGRGRESVQVGLSTR